MSNDFSEGKIFESFQQSHELYLKLGENFQTLAKGRKEEIEIKNKEISVLKEQITELKHSNEIKQVKIDCLTIQYSKNQENSIAQPNSPIFTNNTKLTVNAINSDIIEKKSINSIQSIKNAKSAEDGKISNWIKVAKRTKADYGNKDLLDPNEKNNIVNIINVLEENISKSSLQSEKQKEKEKEKEKEKGKEKEQSNKKDDYIVQLFTQTIGHSQENNGFFELKQGTSKAPENNKKTSNANCVEPVRNKEERSKLKGVMCEECKKV